MSTFGFLPNNLYTSHLGANTSGRSPRLWNSVTGSMMASDGSKRLVLAGEDFTSFGGTLSSTTGTYWGEAGPYLTWQSNAADTVAQLAAIKGGVLRMTATNADEDAVTIQSGYGVAGLGSISPTPGSDFLTAFEARFRINVITDALVNVFIGLGEPGLCAAATTLFSVEGVIADVDVIGFHIQQDDGDQLQFVYRNSGSGAGATTEKIYNQTTYPFTDSTGTAVALVASQWYKIGYLYDPNALTSKKISIYLDNVEQGIHVTGANMAAVNFPDKFLAFTAAMQIEGTADTFLDIDWWNFAQLI